MKKTLLNTALTIAISSSVFSGSVLPTQSYASTADMENKADNTLYQENDNKSFTIPTGAGIGAASGILLAGPVGMITGGIIGAFIGSSIQNDDTDDETDDSNAHLADSSIKTDGIAENITDDSSDIPTVANVMEPEAIMLAQAGPVSTLSDSLAENENSEIINILANDISLDIYFRSGSSDVESFYTDRLTALARLLEAETRLDLHLDGYTDRRGEKLQNIELARQRIESVRQELAAAGVDENRIISKAHGEIKMVSAAGDLEAYNFDRKVVIRFALSPASTSTASNIRETTAEQSDEVTALNTSVEPSPVKAETPDDALTSARLVIRANEKF
jgi:outer membrane protein OmpA-like peptidoglycan-associated protein